MPSPKRDLSTTEDDQSRLPRRRTLWSGIFDFVRRWWPLVRVGLTVLHWLERLGLITY